MKPSNISSINTAKRDVNKQNAEMEQWMKANPKKVKRLPIGQSTDKKKRYYW